MNPFRYVLEPDIMQAMTEGSPIPQEPQALNHQLIALYDLLPRRDMRFQRVEATRIETEFGLPAIAWPIRPEPSELKDRIMVQLGELLPQSHITVSFQQRIGEVFEGLCDNGTWKVIKPDHDEMRGLHGDKLADQMQKDFIYDTVIVNSMDGGGIFDPNDAMRIERIAYQREFLIQMSTNAAMTRLYRNLNLKGGNNGEYKLDPNSSRAKIIQKWRQEFIEKYNEEP